ncbi:MAG: 2-dehydropantoate 2-reductase [Vulcanimicrobiaceae bacterium]|jgi:2-dehydropantoate 2-reductase
MRWAILGAGAIGSFVGARLRLAGEEVVLLARGAHADALLGRGLTLLDVGGERQVDVGVETDAARVGPVDVLVLALKAHQLRDALPAITALCGAATTVVSMQNGIPWWYPLGHPIAAGWELTSVDPGGVLAHAIPTQNTLAASLYLAATIVAPGVVRHTHGERIVLGAVAPAGAARMQPVVAALTRAGFRVDQTDTPRREIWAKLLGNAAFNPVSALSRATMGQIQAQPRVMRLVRGVMLECLAVAAALGDAPAIDPDARIAQSPQDDTKTSMLQDLEAGRPLEIDALLGAVVELGERSGTAVPLCSVVYGLVTLLNRRT